MNILSVAKQTQAIAALVEGCSINSTVRMTGVSKHTILNLIEDLGCACAEYHNRIEKELGERKYGQLSTARPHSPLLKQQLLYEPEPNGS